MSVGAFTCTGCWALLVLLPAGCGHDTTVPDQLSGAKVATMAEHELEAENPGIAPATLTCPDLAFRVGASVRCLRTTQLSGGRVVKVRGTVEVSSLSSGGRLHVVMDDRADEFGLAGKQLASELRARLMRRPHTGPSAVECPYLRGVVGTRVTCRLEAAGVRHPIHVLVTAVDPHSYRTVYTSKAPHVGAN